MKETLPITEPGIKIKDLLEENPLVDTLGKAYAPKLAGLAVYVLMAAVLIWRPSGLFGQRQ